MTELLKLIRDLCLRRRGPQDMPYSPRLLLVLIGVNLAVSLAASALVEDSSGSLSRVLLLGSFDLIALNMALSLRQVRGRFIQTASALFACATVFALLLLPVQFAMLGLSAEKPAQSVTPVQMLALWLALGLFIWKLMVDANILRHALNLPLAGAYLLALLWVVAQGALLIGIFGDTL